MLEEMVSGRETGTIQIVVEGCGGLMKLGDYFTPVK